MTAHRAILNSVARTIAESTDVRDYCIANFGKGLAVHVGAYAAAVPGEKDAPFCWITPQEENEATKEDDIFTVRIVIGGLVKGSGGEKVITNVVIERTDTANGLTLNGGNAIVEDLRDLILVKVRNANAGAIVNRIRREENDIAHFPLEWATFYVEYLEPDSLSDYLNPPTTTASTATQTDTHPQTELSPPTEDTNND